MNNNNIISFIGYLLNEGNFDHLKYATDEQKEKLEQIRSKNQTAYMKDSWTQAQRVAWAMGETDSPDYPENASEYEDRLRDQGIRQGREDFARRREEEAQKRKDNPTYDALQRMRADEKYFDRASDKLIASGPRHSDGRPVTVSQSSKDKARLRNQKIARSGGKNLSYRREGNILSPYLKDPEFSYVGSGKNPFTNAPSKEFHMAMNRNTSEVRTLDTVDDIKDTYRKIRQDKLLGNREPWQVERERVEREAGYLETPGGFLLNPNNPGELDIANFAIDSVKKSIKDRYK